jgi:hypothetical protein
MRRTPTRVANTPSLAYRSPRGSRRQCAALTLRTHDYKSLGNARHITRVGLGFPSQTSYPNQPSIQWMMAPIMANYVGRLTYRWIAVHASISGSGRPHVAPQAIPRLAQSHCHVLPRPMSFLKLSVISRSAELPRFCVVSRRVIRDLSQIRVISSEHRYPSLGRRIPSLRNAEPPVRMVPSRDGLPKASSRGSIVGGR